MPPYLFSDTLSDFGFLAQSYDCRRDYTPVGDVTLRSGCTNGYFTFSSVGISNHMTASPGIMVMAISPISSDRYRILGAYNSNGAHLFEVYLYGDRFVLDHYIDYISLSGYSGVIALAPHVFNGYWFCSYQRDSNTGVYEPSRITSCPKFGGISPYSEKSVDFTLASVLIFIAIVACAVRLFIYPFWRKIRSKS